MRRPPQTMTNFNNEDAEEEDDNGAIDFSNAILYVGGMQAITSVVVASVSAIACCVFVPMESVSAVRSLTVSSVLAWVIVRKPFRIGKVHGLRLVFSALQPCPVIYLLALTLQQLIHGCARDASAPAWRSAVFNISMAVMLISGFARARKPLAATDTPFLVTLIALLVVAVFPPPPLLLSGPLCASPTLLAAAERVGRALLFAFTYAPLIARLAPTWPRVASNARGIVLMRAGTRSSCTPPRRRRPSRARCASQRRGRAPRVCGFWRRRRSYSRFPSCKSA